MHTACRNSMQFGEEAKKKLCQTTPSALPSVSIIDTLSPCANPGPSGSWNAEALALVGSNPASKDYSGLMMSEVSGTDR